MSTDGSPPLIVDLYRQIRRIREFETKTISLFQDGIVPGFTHTYVGQEAVAVGACSCLRTEDRVGSTHRGHGHLIAKGANVDKMMAEILGRSEGYCQGMSGEMHIMDPSIGILGANGIVGAGIPVAVGAALADQLATKPNVTVVFFGDGATSEGYFAEGLNLASIWTLPVVFICENNLYGEFTPASEVCAGEIARRADGYGIPGVSVDGQEVLEVREVVEDAVQRARAGGGPTLIEAKTYRWYGHMYGEEALIGSQRYRSKEEIEYWMTNRDPVQLARDRALAEGTASAETLDAIDGEAAREIEHGAEFALAAPEPPPEQALEFVYATALAGPGGLE